ncbi:MAG: response regulator transcription factor [Alkalinema sp. RU_4_3]|nr:response regulator transcription factor [Alkalinema sp. RU_4_3]
MTIRVLLVDDQSIIRRGLSAVLELEPGLEIVGEADHGEMAIAQVAALRPDVVLMDVRMPVMDGVAATRVLAQQADAPKILVLTTFDDTAAATQALQAGASGYLLKDTPIEELVQAIQLVHRGYSQLAPGLAQRLLTPPAPSSTETVAFAGLTPREQEILQCIAQGASNREIAQQLYISERTVRNHVTSILSQLGLRDRTQAALWAQRQH